MILFIGFLFSISANACPQLAGKYKCAAYGAHQPESVLSVSQSQIGEMTYYKYKFDFLDEESLVPASTNGVYDIGAYRICEGDHLKVRSLGPNGPGAMQDHFIDAAGDYVVIVKGKEVQRCVCL